jgi:energy-coupling factor transporter ATP-binding protein EcfA2
LRNKNRQRANIIGVLFQEAENQLFHSKVAEEVALGCGSRNCLLRRLRNAPRRR